MAERWWGCTSFNIKRMHFCDSEPWLTSITQKVGVIPLLKYHNHQGVPPKDRSITANSGTMAVVLPKGRCSTANSGTKVAVLLGMNRCASLSFIFALQIVGVAYLKLRLIVIHG